MVPQRRRHRRDRLPEAADSEAGDAAFQSGSAGILVSTGEDEVSVDDAPEKDASDASLGKQDERSDEDSGVDVTPALTAGSAADGVAASSVDAARDGAPRGRGTGNSKAATGGEVAGGGAAGGKRPRRAKTGLSEKDEGTCTHTVENDPEKSAHGGKRKGRAAIASAAAAGSAQDESTAVGVAAAPGLENKTGQHSCFVNVVVQTLWNVSAFRDAFLVCEPHAEARGEDRSIFLAMKQVCIMMEDGSAAAAATADTSQSKPQQATASALKEALFRLDSSFELGEMHDATEAHEALLEALHRALAPPPVETSLAAVTVGAGSSSQQDALPNANEEKVSVRACNGSRVGPTPEASSSVGPNAVPSDQSSADSFVKHIFSMCMRMEYCRPNDPKEEHSKPVTYDQWTQYVVASELRKHVREAAGDAASPLVRVLRMAAGNEPSTGDGNRQPAPGCNKLQMLRTPRVFTLGLASDTAHASKAEISESLQGIDESLNLRDVCTQQAQQVRPLPLLARPVGKRDWRRLLADPLLCAPVSRAWTAGTWAPSPCLLQEQVRGIGGEWKLRPRRAHCLLRAALRVLLLLPDRGPVDSLRRRHEAAKLSSRRGRAASGLSEVAPTFMGSAHAPIFNIQAARGQGLRVCQREMHRGPTAPSTAVL